MIRSLHISLFFIVFNQMAAYALAPSQRVVLANGFEAVLIENHSMPVVASVVTVKAGSANETIRTSGISHMLEHLLFNGTKKRTQKEIYEEADFYGIYNNAHTGRDFTNYIVLAEKESAWRALDLQADMLFSSTIPLDKFRKEKGVILNEISKDIGSPSFMVEEQFNRHFFYGTPYNLPVIGIPDTIKAIKREEVLKYYKTYYVPNNATAIIMGDFETNKMIRLLKRLYGKIPPGKIPLLPRFNVTVGKAVSTKESRMDVKKTTISFGANIPSIKNRDFYRLNIAAMLFDSTFKSEMNRRLKAASYGEVSSAFAEVDFTRKSALFRADLSFPENMDPGSVASVFYEVVKDFASRPVDTDAVEGVLISAWVEEIKLLEKPHYYGMMKGKFMAAGGWEFNEAFSRRLEQEKGSVGDAISSYFKKMDFKVSIVTPGKLTYAEILPTVKGEYFNPSQESHGVTPESVLLLERWNKGDREARIFSYGAGKGRPVRRADEVKRVVLANSLTVIVNSNPYSEVFAVHLLAKGRSAHEPEGRSGISAFLHHVLKKGTGRLDEGELKIKLASIGATIKAHDNRFIPYDDHYTKNEHSYIRFETVDRFAEEGLRILSEIVRTPRFRSEEIEQVRGDILNILEEAAGSPKKKSLKLLKKRLFKGLPGGAPVMGTKESIEAITQKDLMSYHKLYFSPRNLILTISTSLPFDDVIREVKENFGTMKNITGFNKKRVNIKATSAPSTISVKLGKSQSYFRLGKIFAIKEEEKPALKILGALLSEKLAFELREKLGLVYTLGATFDFYGKFAVFKGSFGTRPKTLLKVEKEALKLIREFKAFSIQERDIKRIVNLYISRNVMRRLSRISQAYYLGIEEFNNLSPGTTKRNILNLRNVSLSEVRYVARKYLNTENLVTVELK